MASETSASAPPITPAGDRPLRVADQQILRGEHRSTSSRVVGLAVLGPPTTMPGPRAGRGRRRAAAARVRASRSSWRRRPPRWGACPDAVSRACTRSGEGPAPRRGSLERGTAGTPRGRAPPIVATVGRLLGLLDREVRLEERDAGGGDASRATPNTDRKSGRFGSTSMSSTASSSPSADAGRRPAEAWPFSSRMPLVVGGDRELVRRAEHALGNHAAELGAAERLVQHRHARAGRRPGHEVAGRHVAHAHDELVLAGAVVTRARQSFSESGWSATRGRARRSRPPGRPTGAARPRPSRRAR